MPKTQPNREELAEYVNEHFPVLDFSVSEDSIEEGSLKVLRHFLPLWSANNLTLKKYTDGITNKLYKVVVEDEKRQYSVLVRIYGTNTEKLIDRDQELQSMVFLSQHGLSSPLVGRFLNGMCYGFIAGSTFSPEDMVAKSKWPKVAKHLAYFHSVSDAGPEVVPSLFHTTLDKWVGLLPHERSDLKSEYKWLKKAIRKNLKKRHPVVAFCHNDLLCANIIYRPSSLAVSPESKPVVSLNTSFSIEPRVGFIDVEYSSFNYTSFDIANHFCEMMGYKVEETKFPSVEFQKSWLKVYLGHWKNLMSLKKENKLPERALEYEGTALPVTDEEVEHLYNEVAPFTLTAHFLWGTWAIVQSTLSDREDFDYKDYSSRLLTVYYHRKKQLFPKA